MSERELEGTGAAAGQAHGNGRDEAEDARRIRDEHGYLTDLGVQLGQERMERFMQGHAQLQAMALFLVMAVTAAPGQDYSDATLDALKSDAEDVYQAANAWAESCVTLAEHWRTQRRMDEAEERRRASTEGDAQSAAFPIPGQYDATAPAAGQPHPSKAQPGEQS